MTTRKRTPGGIPASTLAANISSGVTSLTLAAGDGALWPSTFPFDIIVNRASATARERITVGGRSSDTLNTLTRGIDGTAAQAHLLGDTVEVAVAGSFLDELGQLLGGTAGDLYYYDGTALQKLAKGTALQHLSMNAGATAPAWASDTQNTVVDAAGDMLIGTADNVVAKLATTGLTAWTSYTPTLTQSGAVTKTVTYAKYCQIGKTTLFNVLLTCTGSGTANNPVLIGTPVTAASASIGPIGSGVIQTAGSLVPGIAYLASTTTIQLIDASQANAIGVVLGQTGSIFVSALASGMLVTVCGHFEAA